MTNPLVFGYCDLQWEQSAPYVKSLRACGYRGDIIFLKGTPDCFTQRKYEEFGVGVWPVPRMFDYADVVNFLTIYSGRYTHVFGSDIRDVVYQYNIFNMIQGEDLHLFEEDLTIGEQSINHFWLSSGYGPEVVERLKQQRIICGGAAFGGIQKMLAFYTLLRDNLKVNSQATINYLYYSHLLEATVHPNYEELVWNVGTKIDTVSDDFYTMNGHIVHDDKNRMTPVVVHQYDRHKRMRDAIWGYYG